MLRAAFLLALGLVVAGTMGCDENSGTARAREGSAPAAEACHPSYPDECLDPDAYDYDGEGGEGDGPDYIAGPVTVAADDPFDLDRDGDGTGCDSF